MITVVDDASYQLNDALHINAVFTASGVVAANLFPWKRKYCCNVNPTWLVGLTYLLVIALMLLVSSGGASRRKPVRVTQGKELLVMVLAKVLEWANPETWM